MRRHLALIALFSSLSGVAVAATPAFVDVYRVRVVAGFYWGTHESLALRRVESRAGPFWMAERRTRITNGITGPTTQIERRWIDGRSCPALTQVVEAIGKIPAPASAPPPPFHGARAALATRKADGGYTVRSDYEGPITAWWRGAQETLKPCWGAPLAMVDVNGMLPLTLETDADEAPFVALERGN